MRKNIMLVSENKTVNASGGIENVICSFANEFINRGYDISMVCMDMEEGVPFYPLDSRVNFINLAYQYSDKKLGGYRLFFKKIQKEVLRTFCGSKMKFMGKQIKDPKLQYFFDEFTDRLSKCLLEITPDIIITIGPDSARISLDAQKMTRLKKIPVIPMNHIDVTRADFSEENLRTFRECNVTQSLIPDFVPTFKEIGIDRIVVIPNIVPQYDDSKIVNLVKCKHRIISVGRIDGAGKRQHLIIEAFSKLADKYPEWYVSLYGSVDNKRYKKYLDKMIVKYNLENRIIFEGRSNNIINELHESDIFVFPSEYEGFGLAMTEAMSVGLPVIASKCNIAANGIIENGKTGFLCEDNEIAEYMENLINDIELRIQIGKNAHEAMKAYTASKVWNKWEDFIKETIAGEV